MLVHYKSLASTSGPQYAEAGSLCSPVTKPFICDQTIAPGPNLHTLPNRSSVTKLSPVKKKKTFTSDIIIHPLQMTKRFTCDYSCVSTSKVYVPHFARLAVFVDRFMWDYNGKPLLRTDTDEKWINNNYNFGINDCRACNLWQRKFGRVLEPYRGQIIHR